VSLCFTHLKLPESFDALQQPIQVTGIAMKAAARWRGLLLEGSFVFLGFSLKRLDEVIEILRHEVHRCPRRKRFS
jgi:hypothetical protein